MSMFGSIIELAFSSTSIDADVVSGAFSIRLRLDEWASKHDVPASFPGKSQANFRPDFKVAILGGTPLPHRFLPSDISRYSVYEDERYLTIWLPAPDSVLYVWDFESNAGVMWCTTATMPPWMLGRPMLPLIHAYATQTEWCPLHASAVGRNGKFLLMIGPGRAGKSTAALSCAAAGWQYAGDDFVLINPTRRQVEPLYTSARLRVNGPKELAASLSRFIFAESNEYNDPRFEIRFGAREREAFISGGSIERVLIPRRDGGRNFQTERAKPSEVFSAMMTHTRLCAPGRAEQLTKKLFSAVRMLPAYFVETGNDVTAIPAGLQPILDGAL
jgi:hypothetical protein